MAVMCNKMGIDLTAHMCSCCRQSLGSFPWEVSGTCHKVGKV